MDRDEIINKEFPHSLFGYDPLVVDAFLDEVIRELDRLNNTIDVLSFRLKNELGEAILQNDCLSMQLEYARTGRRFIEAVSNKSGEIEMPPQEEAVNTADDAADDAEADSKDETTSDANNIEQPQSTDNTDGAPDVT